MTIHRALIIGLAAQYRLPAVYNARFLVAAGGLMCYGPSQLDAYRQAAPYRRLDDTGRLWLSGRSSDLIISGGLNVYPKEIELVLDEMAGVTESAVIGLPHPDFGEAVVAVVAGAGEEAAMIAAARTQLAAFKCPKRVIFVDDLPRNAMGKVLKAELRRRYAETFGG